MRTNDLRRGALLSTAAAIGGGAFLIPYKKASLIADAQVVTLALLLASATFSTIGAIAESKGRWRFDRISLQTALALGILSITGNVCGATALTTLEPAIASVILRTQIIFVAIAAAVTLGERLQRSTVIGAVIALGGLAVMNNPSAEISSTTGILWAIGAAASFAAMIVVTRAVADQIRPSFVNAMRLWVAAILLSAVPGTVSRAMETTPWLWLFAAAAALCGPIFSRLCIMYALRHVPAAFHTLVSLASPVFALLFGYLAFRSLPSSHELVGAAVMALGISVPVALAWRRARNLARL